MQNKIKNRYLIYTFTLFVCLCLNSLFLMNAAAQDGIASVSDYYTFDTETIDVPGVDFLAVTASSDFEDYAGYTRSADGEKDIAFTLIDGIFTTYDFPGSQNTYFYALGNNGVAAGYFQDDHGKHHGVILENGELRLFYFGDAVETEVHGISDATGALTGNFIDASGVRRGFSGETVIEIPEAVATYANFANTSGIVVGSYIDKDGLFHSYVRAPDGRFILGGPLLNMEYFFEHGINDAGMTVLRAKAVDDIPRTYIGIPGQIQEFQVPGSVSTEGWNVNQDGSFVGHYDSPDGRRHGFIARPTGDTAALLESQPVVNPNSFTYTYETINIPGIDFLELTASSDFNDYAGNTKSADGQKTIGFTLIDGVFTTYDYPDSQNTYFYALGNDGTAAGYYQDSNGLHHGVILEAGELRQYNFPGGVQTEIFGISDATGALTGNFIDSKGVRRGFSGETIVEVPGAVATYADFVNGSGVVVGVFINNDGVYKGYGRTPDGGFGFVDVLEGTTNEWLFTHGINDFGMIVIRAKAVDDIPRTYVGRFDQFHELRFPGSVSTEGYNINQDGSVVGHYDSPDGRRHGFIARLTTEAESKHFGNAYTVTLSKGLNMLSVPLTPPTPMTAKDLAALTGATTIITLDAENQRFIAWTPTAPTNGFSIEGGKGYIVNVPEARNFAFVGAQWTAPDKTSPAAPTAISTEAPKETWAFVVSGKLHGKPTFHGYKVIARNMRTNSVVTTSVQGTYFAAATADLKQRSVVQAGDTIELRVIGPNGNAESQTLSFKVTQEDLTNAVLTVKLDGIGQPTQNLLLQNYPNPFNPETWIPYQLSEDSSVSVSIYNTTGQLVRTLSLGFQSAGYYNSQGQAAYWDGRNAVGERVTSGIYFYQLTTPSFQQTRRLVIVK